MTTTHPCGRDDLHEKYDGLRATSDALADEIAAAIRPAQKAHRDLSSSEKARVDTVRAARERTATELRGVHHELEDHHLARKCAPTASASGLTPEAAARWGKSTGSPELDQLADRLFGAGATGASLAQGGAKGRDTRWSVKALESMRGRFGTEPAAKSLSAPGSVLVPTAFDTTVLREGERPAFIRQLIPVESITGTDRFAFVRQVARTNRAAPVAPGRVKPTSVYGLAKGEDYCRTLAHLSEPITKQDLDDITDLGQFLDQEMRFGLLWAAEDQFVNGAGAPPADDAEGEKDLTGILATEGIVAQAWAGDLFTTTRRAITVQQQLANTPTAWAMNPADWERFELAREDTATTGGFVLATGPVDRAAQRLWGYPVVAADVVPAGTAILGNWSEGARIYQREQAKIEWSDAMYFAATTGIPASSAFARNQLIMRAEERVGFAVLRPSAFCAVDLTA